MSSREGEGWWSTKEIVSCLLLLGPREVSCLHSSGDSRLNWVSGMHSKPCADNAIIELCLFHSVVCQSPTIVASFVQI